MTMQVLNPSSWEEEKKKEPATAVPAFNSAPAFSSTRLDSSNLSNRHTAGGSLFDTDTSVLANTSGRHTGGGSLFDTTRAGSLFDDTSSFFDRNRTGSIFDNEKSLFAANSEQSGVSRYH
jgi:hypothetical protein